MADKWIQGAVKPENKGKFKKAAEAKGESTLEYAKNVEKNPKASPKLKKEAQLADTLIHLKKKGKK